MTFRITGLSPEPFLPLYGLSDEALALHNARRMIVDGEPGYPDRIEMREVPVGETVLLLNHVSMPASSPYRATHAIFVREGARETFDRVGIVPEVMRRRLLSLRAFDDEGMMRDADVVEGAVVEPVIERLLADPKVSVIHAHYAKRGCYSGRIERA
ncbi:DUF1203 domain-containing protein [Salinarimonas ramus]|uniref:DUF1203 domain-containing protein n=1 Tax=Salinarimonas ramus TaxID=690164 RepID=A0A917V206_9HYPH|nr:DUF1203 domain-containing protein [Salinarimonas ramus]GGK24074.1 hypothetical protein GCM10011322_08420 [Salinarimonas ramus]